MSPRTGRPPKDNPRNINIGLRLSNEEADLLQECAERLDTTRTEIVVKGVKMVKSEIDAKK